MKNKFVAFINRKKDQMIKSTTDKVGQEVKAKVEQKIIAYTPIICAVTGLIISGMGVKTPTHHSTLHVEKIHIERVYIYR